MDRNFLQNLSNLTGLPMAQLLEKLGRIDVVDNPFAKADPERVRPEGSVRGGDTTGGNASVSGAGTATGGSAIGGNATLTSPAPPSINTNTNNVSVSGTGVSNAGAGGENASYPVTNAAPAGNAPQLQVGNGLSAGAANGGPLPSTTPTSSNTMTGNGSGAGGENGVNPGSSPAAAAAAPAASPRGGGGTQAYQLGGVKEGFWGGVNQLASANNISNPNQLSVGQQIKMPDGSSYTVRGGDTLSGIYQNRAPAAAAPAATAPAAASAAAPARAAAAAPGTTGPSGEQIQPNLNRAPPDLTSAPTDPMTNGERRQGNQPPAAGPRPGGSVYSPGTDERTGGGGIQPPAPAPSSTSRVGPNANFRGNTNVGGGGIPPPAAAPTRGASTPGINGPTFQEAGKRLYANLFGNKTPYGTRELGPDGLPRPAGTGTPPLTRSMNKKSAWFSSATHPSIRGY